jgi:ribose 5-phosphate isomerase A
MQNVYDYLNEKITDGSVIGMGSGSTIENYIPAVGRHVEENRMDVTFVPTSIKTEQLLKDHGLTTSLEVSEIEATIDGADNFTRTLDVIKGLGGALLREKQIGYFSENITIIAKSDKETASFENLRIPVEVNPFLHELTKTQIRRLTRAEITERTEGGSLSTTDNGNYTLDCRLPAIEDLDTLHNMLINIPGVIETGIFNRHITEIVSFNNNDFKVHIK